MSKETSKEVAALAGRVMAGYNPNKVELKALAASCLAQREDDPGDYPASAEAGYEPINLRDYFAGQALNGYSSDPEQPFHENYAKWAYETADAMLKEREGGE